MKEYRRLLYIVLVLDVFAITAAFYLYMQEKIPAEVNVIAGEQSDFSLAVPASANVYTADSDTWVKSVDLRQPFSIISNDTALRMEVELFGVIPFKTIHVNVVDPQNVIAGGFPVGIYAKVKGVMVVDCGVVEDVNQGTVSPAEFILKPGDYILEVNGEEIDSRKALMRYLEDMEHKELVLQILRGEKEIQVKVDCALTKDGYKLGVWVRDDMQGIGTLTYVKGKEYAALGHSITDQDTGKIVELGEGKLFQATILQIQKGKVGKPGELSGMISYGNQYAIANIEENTSYGIFGTINGDVLMAGDALAVGYKQDVKEGKAFIRSWVSGEQKDYEIRITKLNMGKADATKSIEIEIVDKELLALTGGIVQGMSGTPIIQDGKLVGAVTHVFVNSPEKGYGVFVEEMLEH